MRAGRIEEANALVARIGKEIASRCKTRLCKVDEKMHSKGMWAALGMRQHAHIPLECIFSSTLQSLVLQLTAISLPIRELSGRKQHDKTVDGVTATSLNQHYLAISTDANYTPPPLKQTTSLPHSELLSEWEVFRLLDALRPTATGLDQIPAWFLKIAAPLFCKLLANFFKNGRQNSLW